jgi:hypothetical protein
MVGIAGGGRQHKTANPMHGNKLRGAAMKTGDRYAIKSVLFAIVIVSQLASIAYPQLGGFGANNRQQRSKAKTQKQLEITFSVNKDGGYNFYQDGRRIAYSKPGNEPGSQTLYATAYKKVKKDTAILDVTASKQEWRDAYWHLQPQPFEAGLGVDMSQSLAAVLRKQPDPKTAGKRLPLPTVAANDSATMGNAVSSENENRLASKCGLSIEEMRKLAGECEKRRANVLDLLRLLIRKETTDGEYASWLKETTKKLDDRQIVSVPDLKPDDMKVGDIGGLPSPKSIPAEYVKCIDQKTKTVWLVAFKLDRSVNYQLAIVKGVTEQTLKTSDRENLLCIRAWKVGEAEYPVRPGVLRKVLTLEDWDSAPLAEYSRLRFGQNAGSLGNP